MKKIAEGVAMLEINLNHFIIHPTLIWDEQKAVLVDAGMPGSLDLIRAEMEKAGVPFEKLDAVILTHQDMDHIGSVRPFHYGVRTRAGQAIYRRGEASDQSGSGKDRSGKMGIDAGRNETDVFESAESESGQSDRGWRSSAFWRRNRGDFYTGAYAWPLLPVS